MNVLFLTIGDFGNFKAGSVHIDLVKEIAQKGHHVYVACTNTDSDAKDLSLECQDGVTFLRIKTGAVKKNTNLIKKGISTILLETSYINAIKNRLTDVNFDLVLYHTPPVTFEKVVRFVKDRDGAASYLLLKDIFPQNAVDLGMMSKKGLKGLVYMYFRRKEKNLYKVSDYIGCMSPANVEYLVRHNPYYPAERVEVAPNSVKLEDGFMPLSEFEKDAKYYTERRYIRNKYGLPMNLPILVYGGNLGKPQGIDYLIKCLDDNKGRRDCFFLIVGSGSEYEKLSSWLQDVKDKERYIPIKLLSSLPKDDYDTLVRSCDVGLIFLDHRFTIPNYPSRLLSYLVNGMPVLCATDPHTDIGRIAEEQGYGYWCESAKPKDFTVLVDKILQSDIQAMGKCGYDFLCKNYLTEHTYQAIFSHFDKNR